MTSSLFSWMIYPVKLGSTLKGKNLPLEEQIDTFNPLYIDAFVILGMSGLFCRFYTIFDGKYC